MLALAAALAWSWSLIPLGIYGVLAGLASVLVGARVISLDMTLQPVAAGLGFILTGAVGVLSAPLYLLKGLPQLRALALFSAILSGLLWAAMGYMAYWSHLGEFSKWKVPGLEQPAESRT